MHVLDVAPARFRAQVDVRGSDECWHWKGQRRKVDRPHVLPYGIYNHRHAHRFLLSLIDPPSSPDLDALHTCDVPYCVNPHHLYWGTPKQNAADRLARGRDGGHKRRGDANVLRAHPDLVKRGSRAANAKLDELTVFRIRMMAMRTCEVARKYGLAKSNASRIVRGETWRHVQVEA